MLDFDLSKMALIGVIALVVLGPERLPRVARTAGALLGRARRYVDELKSQVTREMEMELDELRRMKTQFESTVGRFEDAVDSSGAGRRDALSTRAAPDSPIAIAGSDAPAIGMGNSVISRTSAAKASAERERDTTLSRTAAMGKVECLHPTRFGHSSERGVDDRFQVVAAVLQLLSYSGYGANKVRTVSFVAYIENLDV
jgi:sec-independent protein translocase protein TatB